MFGISSPAYRARQILLQQLEEYPVASAWSPSGSHLAVATADGDIHLFPSENPELALRWRAHDEPVQKLCWHPLEPFLSSAGQDGKIKHWFVDDSDNAVLHAELQPLDAWIEDMAWRPDGRYLAVASGRNAAIFDLAGKLRNTLPFGNSTIAALAWSPRGTELALAGYQGIVLFKGVAGQPSSSKLAWQGSLLTCCWSPDGKVIAACCQDNAVHFWRVQSRRDAQMSGYPVKPRAMAFTPDSKYLVTGGSETLTCWEFFDNGPEGKAPLELRYHKDIVTSLSVDSLTGQIAAGSKDGVVSLWHGPTARVPYYHFAMSDVVISTSWKRLENMQLLACLDRSGHVGIWEFYQG